jgi:dipeptidyl aminopeptidase/acylaminoacyl peptidase
MPEAGGQSIYIQRAYGDLAAFLFGWIFFLAYMTGGVASLALAFAEYLSYFLPVLGTGNILSGSGTGLLALSAGELVAIGEGKKAFTVDDMLDLVEVGGVVMTPDAETFAFHASDDASFELRNGYLWVMNPDTGERRKLEGQNTGETDHLLWTPDGKSLLFNEVHGTNTNLYRVDIATGRLEAMTRATGTLRVESYSRDRTSIAYVLSDCATPPDLYSADVHGGNAVRITRANPWVEEVIVVPSCRVIQWKGDDGLQLEGVFMLPADQRPGTRAR